MGGQRLLINPNLEGVDDMPPEKVHELVDYVVITTAKDDFLHGPTLARMNMAKVNFVASDGAGEILSQQMVRNLAVLAPGPGGRVMLAGEAGSVPLAVLVTPGASGGLPWQSTECGFIFVNLETGVALAYEAQGQFLGPGAASDREGIPEEAYQVDYLVTPDLREGASVAAGLTQKGAALRAVVHLPGPAAAAANDSGKADEGVNPLLAPLFALDRGLDSALGGPGVVNDPREFLEFLQKQGPPLSETRLVQPEPGGGAVDLE